MLMGGGRTERLWASSAAPVCCGEGTAEPKTALGLSARSDPHLRSSDTDQDQRDVSTA